MGGAYSTYREEDRCICTYMVLVGKPDGKGTLGRPRRKWKWDVGGGVWTGLRCLRIGAVGGQL